MMTRPRKWPARMRFCVNRKTSTQSVRQSHDYCSPPNRSHLSKVRLGLISRPSRMSQRHGKQVFTAAFVTTATLMWNRMGPAIPQWRNVLRSYRISERVYDEVNLRCTDSEPCISCAGMFVYGGNETCREAATQLSITWRTRPALASHRCRPFNS